MNDGGDAHCHAKPVMPQSEMRNLDGRKQLYRPCKQRGYEQDNQNPGVGVEPSEFLLQGVQHFMELCPVDKQKCRHGISEYPVNYF